MRVGIISMQRITNYGSFLQSYGLRGLIESLGHTVEFIDFKPGKPVIPYSKIRRAWMFLKIDVPIVARAYDWLRYRLSDRYAFTYKCRTEYMPMLGITYRYEFHKPVDIAVIGSDEVFNCLQPGTNIGFSPMLFGQDIGCGKVISYAASCGYTNLDGIRRYHIGETLGKFFDSFAAISVRDANTKEVVETLSHEEAVNHLDPVLVSEFPLPEVDAPNDYVILYTYGSREYSDGEKEQIKSFCKRNGKTLVSIGDAQQWVDRKIEANPFEALSYFRKADFVITDTFHGSVFSIKYNKNFAVRIREDNKEKLGDLLERLGMTGRRITDYSQLQAMYESPPDYRETNELISKEKGRTMEYLRENLR